MWHAGDPLELTILCDAEVRQGCEEPRSPVSLAMLTTVADDPANSCQQRNMSFPSACQGALVV